MQEMEVSNQHKPVLIFKKAIDEDCASFEVFNYGEGQEYYKKSIEKRDDASFYYVDEEKEELIIQKKISDDEYQLKYIFLFHKKTYEIILKSCGAKLTYNKKELNLLHQKIINEALYN